MIMMLRARMYGMYSLVFHTPTSYSSSTFNFFCIARARARNETVMPAFVNKIHGYTNCRNMHIIPGFCMCASTSDDGYKEDGQPRDDAGMRQKFPIENMRTSQR